MTRPLRNPLFAQLATDAWEPARAATETIIDELDRLVDRVLRNPPVLALYTFGDEFVIVDLANGFRRMILPTSRPVAVGWALRFKLDCPEARLHGSLLSSEGEPMAACDSAGACSPAFEFPVSSAAGRTVELTSPSDSFSVRVPDNVVPIREGIA